MIEETFQAFRLNESAERGPEETQELLKVTVRSGRRQDAALLIPLGRKMLNLHCRLEPTYMRAAADVDFAGVWGEYLQRFLNEGHSQVLVAEAEGRAIGYALLTIRPRPPVVQGPPEVLVAELYVDEEFRGRGVGQCLLHVAYDWARQRGAATAALHVFDRNEEAVAFYERMGFRLVERVMVRQLAAEGAPQGEDARVGKDR